MLAIDPGSRIFKLLKTRHQFFSSRQLRLTRYDYSPMQNLRCQWGCDSKSEMNAQIYQLNAYHPERAWPAGDSHAKIATEESKKFISRRRIAVNESTVILRPKSFFLNSIQPFNSTVL
jgi:hypothetical protein